MNRNSFKLSVFLCFCVIFVIYGLKGSPASAFSGGPPTGNTDAPGEDNCTSCHGGIPNSGSGTLTITGLPATYMPNQEIPVTVTMGQSGRSRFGFQLTAIDSQGRKAGDLVVTDTSRMQLGTDVIQNNLRQYIFHTFVGTTPNGTNQSTWTFTWKAPAQSVGRVTFYAAGNAANNNGASSGDLIYTKNANIEAGNPPLRNFASANAASFSQTMTAAADSILAGFSTELSQNTVTASATPLPTQLDGTEVEVKDSANTARNAGLFFVSPQQVNYLVPSGTVNGTATVTVKRNGTAVAQGSISIETIAPGIFTANADGQGVPAAVLFRRRGTVDTNEDVAMRDPQTNRFVPISLDLGPEGDIVALIVFGTALRGAMQSSVTCTISGTPATVIFSGAQGMLVGLDQVNILLPRSLMGQPDLVRDVVLSFGGKMANTFQIKIK